MVWDIGAIAASGRPDALELAQKIVLASATIPGVFPPVRLQVSADGRTYDELHVDGGVTRQVFLLPPGYDPEDGRCGTRVEAAAARVHHSKWQTDPQFEAVEATFLPIANRSIATLIKTQGIGDLYRIYLFTRRNNIDYNVAYVPSDFRRGLHHDVRYGLYAIAVRPGYEQASRTYRWHKAPPGY